MIRDDKDVTKALTRITGVNESQMRAELHRFAGQATQVQRRQSIHIDARVKPKEKPVLLDAGNMVPNAFGAPKAPPVEDQASGNRTDLTVVTNGQRTVFSVVCDLKEVLDE